MKYAYGVPCGLAAAANGYVPSIPPPLLLHCYCIAAAGQQPHAHTETPRPFRGLAREDPEFGARRTNN
jgi:hypothetical protein